MVQKVDRFKAQNACDQEGFTPDREKLCYNSDELQKVNPRSPVGGKPTSTDALDEMLCVEKMNREAKVLAVLEFEQHRFYSTETPVCHQQLHSQKPE